jgi:hypothetical protein
MKVLDLLLPHVGWREFLPWEGQIGPVILGGIHWLQVGGILLYVMSHLLMSTIWRGSKMATGTQTQTAWALGIRDLAETLETHLAEVKYQGELQLQHSLFIACGRLLHLMIHWKNRWAATHLPAHQAPTQQARLTTTSWYTTCPLVCWHTSRHPKEGSNNTRLWLQTCLGDADK